MRILNASQLNSDETVEEFVTDALKADSYKDEGGDRHLSLDTAAAFGRLIDLLASRGLLSAQDIHVIACSYEYKSPTMKLVP